MSEKFVSTGENISGFNGRWKVSVTQVMEYFGYNDIFTFLPEQWDRLSIWDKIEFYVGVYEELKQDHNASQVG